MQNGRRPLAVVTGASAGIGVGFATVLAERGYDLALVARRVDRLEALAAALKAEHGAHAFAVGVDLSRPDACELVMAALAARGAEPEALVNNAGYSLPKSYLATSWAEQRDFVMTLVMAVCGLTHALLPAMVAKGTGRIINLGSMAGLSPGGPGHTLYPAAKSFVNKFSVSLDAELRGQGVKITCVNPGFVESEFAKANGMEEILEKSPARRAMSAETLARLTLAANDRGQVIYVPGVENKVAAGLMKYLPDSIVRPIIRMGAERYRMKD